MSNPLRGRIILPAEALRAAADGGVEITQANPTREACADVSAYQERSRIFRGMSFSRDEIVQAWHAFRAHVDMLDAAVIAMAQEFDAERQVSCKAACEVIADSAARLSARPEPQQVATLAGSLAGTFATHLARRPRA